jgi:transposase
MVYSYMYSKDKDDAQRLLDLWASYKDIANLYDVSVTTIKNLIKWKHKKLIVQYKTKTRTKKIEVEEEEIKLKEDRIKECEKKRKDEENERMKNEFYWMEEWIQLWWYYN